MKHILVAMIALVISLTASANSSSEQLSSISARPYANINTDAWSLGLNNIALTYGSVTKTTFMSMGPSVEYFFMDRASLGMATHFSTSFAKNSTTLSAGPSATYHFFSEGRLSLYGNTAYILHHLTTTGASVTGSLNLSVGGNYHFTPWFGLGPKVTTSISSAATDLTIEAINLTFYL